MENPATWGPAEHAVQEAITEDFRDNEAGIIGLSLARKITDKLRAKGLLGFNGWLHPHLNFADCPGQIGVYAKLLAGAVQSPVRGTEFDDILRGIADCSNNLRAHRDRLAKDDIVPIEGDHPNGQS